MTLIKRNLLIKRMRSKLSTIMCPIRSYNCRYLGPIEIILRIQPKSGHASSIYLGIALGHTQLTHHGEWQHEQ